jgi:hypothetical protein
MTFDPNFDLTKFQAQKPPSDGRFHVRVVGLDSGVLYQDLPFETEAEARAEAIKIRDAGDGKAGLVFNPNWDLIGTYFIQDWDWSDI